MEIYQRMYYKLFNAVTDAIRILPESSNAAKILIAAQQECEEIFISEDEQEPATASEQ